MIISEYRLTNFNQETKNYKLYDMSSLIFKIKD